MRCPSLTHRVTVRGSTWNSAATSAEINMSGVGSMVELYTRTGLIATPGQNVSPIRLGHDLRDVLQGPVAV